MRRGKRGSPTIGLSHSGRYTLSAHSDEHTSCALTMRRECMTPLTDAEHIFAAFKDIDDRQVESLLSRLHESNAYPGITVPVLQYHRVRLLCQLGGRRHHSPHPLHDLAGRRRCSILWVCSMLDDVMRSTADSI